MINILLIVLGFSMGFLCALMFYSTGLRKLIAQKAQLNQEGRVLMADINKGLAENRILIECMKKLETRLQNLTLNKPTGSDHWII